MSKNFDDLIWWVRQWFGDPRAVLVMLSDEAFVARFKESPATLRESAGAGELTQLALRLGHWQSASLLVRVVDKLGVSGSECCGCHSDHTQDCQQSIRMSGDAPIACSYTSAVRTKLTSDKAYFINYIVNFLKPNLDACALMAQDMRFLLSQAIEHDLSAEFMWLCNNLLKEQVNMLSDQLQVKVVGLAFKQARKGNQRYLLAFLNKYCENDLHITRLLDSEQKIAVIKYALQSGEEYLALLKQLIAKKHLNLDVGDGTTLIEHVFSEQGGKHQIYAKLIKHLYAHFPVQAQEILSQKAHAVNFISALIRNGLIHIAVNAMHGQLLDNMHLNIDDKFKYFDYARVYADGVSQVIAHPALFISASQDDIGSVSELLKFIKPAVTLRVYKPREYIDADDQTLQREGLSELEIAAQRGYLDITMQLLAKLPHIETSYKNTIHLAILRAVEFKQYTTAYQIALKTNMLDVPLYEDRSLLSLLCQCHYSNSGFSENAIEKYNRIVVVHNLVSNPAVDVNRCDLAQFDLDSPGAVFSGTPLFRACKADEVDCVKKLCENGAFIPYHVYAKNHFSRDVSVILNKQINARQALLRQKGYDEYTFHDIDRIEEKGTFVSENILREPTTPPTERKRSTSQLAIPAVRPRRNSLSALSGTSNVRTGAVVQGLASTAEMHSEEAHVNTIEPPVLIITDHDAEYSPVMTSDDDRYSVASFAMTDDDFYEHALSKTSYNNLITLIANGLNPTKPNKDGQTPLHIAVRKGYYDYARFLLILGVPANVQDKWGRTPYHYAAIDNKPGFTDLFKDYNSDKRIKDKLGFSPDEYMQMYTEDSGEQVKLLDNFDDDTDDSTNLLPDIESRFGFDDFVNLAFKNSSFLKECGSNNLKALRAKANDYAEHSTSSVYEHLHDFLTGLLLLAEYKSIHAAMMSSYVYHAGTQSSREYDGYISREEFSRLCLHLRAITNTASSTTLTHLDERSNGIVRHAKIVLGASHSLSLKEILDCIDALPAYRPISRSAYNRLEKMIIDYQLACRHVILKHKAPVGHVEYIAATELDTLFNQNDIDDLASRLNDVKLSTRINIGRKRVEKHIMTFLASQTASCNSQTIAKLYNIVQLYESTYNYKFSAKLYYLLKTQFISMASAPSNAAVPSENTVSDESAVQFEAIANFYKAQYADKYTYSKFFDKDTVLLKKIYNLYSENIDAHKGLDNLLYEDSGQARKLLSDAQQLFCTQRQIVDLCNIVSPLLALSNTPAKAKLLWHNTARFTGWGASSYETLYNKVVYQCRVAFNLTSSDDLVEGISKHLEQGNLVLLSDQQALVEAINALHAHNGARMDEYKITPADLKKRTTLVH